MFSSSAGLCFDIRCLTLFGPAAAHIVKLIVQNFFEMGHNVRQNVHKLISNSWRQQHYSNKEDVMMNSGTKLIRKEGKRVEDLINQVDFLQQ